MKNRNVRLDILKCFGIITVVCGHCLAPSNVLSKLMYLVNLPLFFFVAGYLYKSKNSNNERDDIWYFFGKKVKRFWIYYFGYGLFLVLFHNIFLDLGILPSFYPRYYIRDFLFGILNAGLFISNELFSSAMWFIPVMIISIVLFKAIDYNSAKLKHSEVFRFLFVIFSMLIGIYLNDKNINIGLHYQTSFVVLPFIYIGFLFKKIKFDKIKSSFNISILIITIVCTYFCIMNIDGKIDMAHNNLWNPFLFYILPSLIAYSLYYLSGLIRNKRIISIISYVGEHTIPIMCLHFVVIKVIDLVYIKLVTHNNQILSAFPYSYDKLLIVYLIAGIVIPIIIEYIINKVVHLFKKKLSFLCNHVE